MACHKAAVSPNPRTWPYRARSADSEADAPDKSEGSQMAEMPDVKCNENDGRPGDFAKGIVRRSFSADGGRVVHSNKNRGERGLTLRVVHAAIADRIDAQSIRR